MLAILRGSMENMSYEDKAALASQNFRDIRAGKYRRWAPSPATSKNTPELEADKESLQDSRLKKIIGAQMLVIIVLTGLCCYLTFINLT